MYFTKVFAQRLDGAASSAEQALQERVDEFLNRIQESDTITIVKIRQTQAASSYQYNHEKIVTISITYKK